MTKLVNTIVSYPQRGPWGDGAWNGNTSGHLIMDLIDTYEPTKVLDPMEGSGTTRDVCAERSLTYLGYDIKKGDDILSPITQMKIFREVEAIGLVDMVFLHPPYWGMVRYSDKGNDLSNGPYSLWINRMTQIISFASRLLTPKGFIALLLADYRTGGQTYFLTDDVTTLGATLQAGLDKEIRYIKVQHKTNSRGRVEIPGNVAFVHEYLTILRKRGAFNGKV